MVEIIIKVSRKRSYNLVLAAILDRIHIFCDGTHSYVMINKVWLHYVFTELHKYIVLQFWVIIVKPLV